MLQKFKAYLGTEQTGAVYINPEHVTSIVELPPGAVFDKHMAVVELATGEKHTVYDEGRDVAEKLSGAQPPEPEGDS